VKKKFVDIFTNLDKTVQNGQTDGHRPTAKTALTYSLALY